MLTSIHYTLRNYDIWFLGRVCIRHRVLAPWNRHRRQSNRAEPRRAVISENLSGRAVARQMLVSYGPGHRDPRTRPTIVSTGLARGFALSLRCVDRLSVGSKTTHSHNNNNNNTISPKTCRKVQSEPQFQWSNPLVEPEKTVGRPRKIRRADSRAMVTPPVRTTYLAGFGA